MTSVLGSRCEGSRESPTTMLGNASTSRSWSKGGRTLQRLAANRVSRAFVKRTKTEDMSHPPRRVPHASKRVAERPLHGESEGDGKKQVAGTACRIEIRPCGVRPRIMQRSLVFSPTWRR